MELPRDWENLITHVQRKPPITVTRSRGSRHSTFTEWHRQEPVSWQKIKWTRYSPDHPAQILYKYTYQNDHFKILDLSKKKKKSLTSANGLFAHINCTQTTTTFCTKTGISPSFTALQSPSQLPIIYSIPLHTHKACCEVENVFSESLRMTMDKSSSIIKNITQLHQINAEFY